LIENAGGTGTSSREPEIGNIIADIRPKSVAMIIAQTYRMVFSGGELGHATKQTADPMAAHSLATPPPTFLPAVWLATP
jgi:hypothetical protein